MTIMIWQQFSQTWPIVRGIHQGTANFPHTEPVMRSFDIIFFLSLDKKLNKQSSCRCFDTLWSSYDVTVLLPYLETRWCHSDRILRDEFDLELVCSLLRYKPPDAGVKFARLFGIELPACYGRLAMELEIEKQVHPLTWVEVEASQWDVWLKVSWNEIVRHVMIGSLIHDDVIKWKHFQCNWPFVRGIHRSPVNSPHKGQWRGALIVS